MDEKQDRYAKYINSLEWQNRPERLQAIQRDCGRCVLCNSSEDLEVHHRTYENFGNEKLEDLYTFCRQCHEIVTDALRRRKYEAVQPVEVADSKILKYEGQIQSSKEKSLPSIADATNSMPDMTRYKEVASVHKDCNVSDSRSDAHPVPQWSDRRSSERVDKTDQDDFGQEEENRRRP